LIEWKTGIGKQQWVHAIAKTCGEEIACLSFYGSGT